MGMYEQETRQVPPQPGYGGPMGGPGYGYGPPMGWGYRMRPAFPVETKPFFLTSEFWAALALIVGLAITAGTSESLDARLFWILTTAVVSVYIFSRGVAKSGTKSRSWDPREDLMDRMRERTGSDGGREGAGAQQG